MYVLKNGRCSDTAVSSPLQSHPSNPALSSAIIQSHILYSSADANAPCRYSPFSTAIYQYLSPLPNATCFLTSALPLVKKDPNDTLQDSYAQLYELTAGDLDFHSKEALNPWSPKWKSQCIISLVST